jgi:molybdate transport system ATP-binding protein
MAGAASGASRTGAGMIEFEAHVLHNGFTLDARFHASKGITALFGPSGSGKSTIIRLIAGLERPDTGRIVFDDAVLLDTATGINVPAHRRRIGLVFQDAQLFAHLSVQQNLDYGRWFTARTERRIALEPVVDVLGIRHLLHRSPGTLSGGERQRVAIGRALLASPRLLLMDEPLASLDAERRYEILPFIEHLRDEFGIPILYISHALEEVARLADRIVLLKNGRVVDEGDASAVLPNTSATRGSSIGHARFETVSLLSATVARHDAAYGLSILSHPAGEISVAGQVGDKGQQVRVGIRATDVALSLTLHPDLSVRTVLAATVLTIEPHDQTFAMVGLSLFGGEDLQVSLTRRAIADLGLVVGRDVFALVKSAALAPATIATRAGSAKQSP